MSSTAFFVGYGLGRLEILQKSFSVITSKVDNCRFYIAGVKEENKEKIPGVQYNVTFPYAEELQMAYNTDCIVEIVKEGQTGVSLRTCEAIAFNKKLLTNNQNLQEMPFFDGRFMSVFEDPSEIDIDFIKRKMNVHYTDSNYFSPLKVIEKLQNLHDARMTNTKSEIPDTVEEENETAEETISEQDVSAQEASVPETVVTENN